MSEIKRPSRVIQHSPVSEQSSAESGVAPSSQRGPEVARELPDVTGFLVVVLVAVGLFIVPVGATLMQGPAIVASLFSSR